MLTHDPAGDFRGLEYLPIVLRRRVKEDKNAKVGFCQVVSAVRNCLLDNKIPTIANVHEYVADTGEGWQVPQHTHYFQMGGTLEYAIDLVVGFTKHNNLVHGGVEARTDGHLALTDGPNELLEEIELLTRCETNDDNFGLVRRKVFEGGELVKGPY